VIGSGTGGPILIGVIAAALAAALYLRVQRTPVRPGDLDRTHYSPDDEGRAAGTPASAAA
jgi:hypothetical protein